MYRYHLGKNVLPALGSLRLVEIDTPLVEAVILDLHERIGAATARTCRTIISGVMRLAVSKGAIASNPTREIEQLEGKRKRPARALTVEERARWFDHLSTDEAAKRRGLFALSAVLLATGLGIGEVLGLLWRDVDLDAATLEVNATVIRLTGQGLVRKPKPKSTAGEREMDLPAWCVAILRELEDKGVDPDEPVFGTVDGGLLDPRNVHRWLKDAREAVGLDWVTAHSWRKTSATVLDESGATARMIADRLGHSRVSMTLDTYLGRKQRSHRVVEALESVDPRPRSEESTGKSTGSEGRKEA